MKVLIAITGPFEGGDPGTAPTRVMSIGRVDRAELVRDVTAWVHDVVARMVDAPDDADEAEDDEPGLWDEVA